MVVSTHNNILIHQLNASDDRGINVVRGPIINFASTRTIFKSGFKLVILDEADAMTKDAQNALRRGVSMCMCCCVLCIDLVIEKFTDNVRFCLICNYLSHIIPALQSRCTRFRFAPLSPQQMTSRIEHVAHKEKCVLCALLLLSRTVAVINIATYPLEFRWIST